MQEPEQPPRAAPTAFPPTEPKDLAVVADELEAVLARHNVAGAFVVTTTAEGGGRFAFPQWATFSTAGGKLAVRMEKDPDGNWTPRSTESLALLMKLARMVNVLGNELMGHLQALAPRVRHESPRIQLATQMPKMPVPGLPRGRP